MTKGISEMIGLPLTIKFHWTEQKMASAKPLKNPTIPPTSGNHPTALFFNFKASQRIDQAKKIYWIAVTVS